VNEIISKLDLANFIETFNSFLARDKPLFMEGDLNLHYNFLQKLSTMEFKAPKEVKNLDKQLMYLKKRGTLKIYEIYEFVKIVEYFVYLKKCLKEDFIKRWLEKIIIPQEIMKICSYFDLEGELRDEIDERFLEISSSLKRNKERIKESMRRLLSTQRLSAYLVDSQIHYINESETLLVRGGFNRFLKGSVVARSSGGYFYVVPDSIMELKKSQANLLDKKDEIILEYEKKISATFCKFEPFLRFINNSFDRFDAYQARIFFAKSQNLEFLKPQKDRRVKITDFSHPAIKDPKPVSIDFSKKILLITGVNAGGKTMMLKSILSVVFLAKHLLPMKINPHKSHIGSFKEITAIIDDPQSVKNDISTFAGRMTEFAKLLAKNDFIAGVDEIELGTDADEAASLFKVILENLCKKDVKLVITTHHKRLASMMATHPDVELAAAIYDQIRQKPTFEFLYGSIGKSYAFETAQRYGISATLIEKAKTVYGEDKEKLNDLIQRNIDMELQNRERLNMLDMEIEKTKKLNKQLKNQKEESQKILKERKRELEVEYQKAIDEAKKAARGSHKSEIHKLMNKAHKRKTEALSKETVREGEPLKVGEFVKYKNTNGEILSLKKEEAMILCDGIKFRAPINELRRIDNYRNKKPEIKTKIKIEKPSRSSIKLDLHGLRAQEAIDKLDYFLSDALITGYDEVLIYHGIGSGKLAFAVKEFLKTHPKIKSFSDAPPNMGGMGATLVRL